jgi:TolB-like protein
MAHQEDTMVRPLSFAARPIVAGIMAVVAAVAPLAGRAAAQDTRPVVVVFTFTNSSIGPARAEFDGIATGVQDLLITDMASNPRIRLVDRSRIDAVLQEQNMVKANQIDPATAVRLGKIMGAQYAVVGGFIADGKGNAILTGRTIDMETTQIANPEKVTGKSDDVLAIIGQLSAKLGSDMKLDAKPGRRVGDAGGAGAPASTERPATVVGSAAAPAPAAAAAKPTAVQSGTPAAVAKMARTETYAKPMSPKAARTKLDVATMKIYSNALDEMDKKNNAKAAELFKEVIAKFPDFEPAQNHLAQIKAS